MRKLCAPLTVGASGSKLLVLNFIVAASASGAAGFFNTLSMRYTEINKGISIYKDEDLTQEIGVSNKCAEKAVVQTAMSRFGMSWIGLAIPTALMVMTRRVGVLPKNKWPKMGVELACVGTGIYCSMPLSVALFPSKCSLPANKLEPEYGNHESVYYNRGM